MSRNRRVSPAGLAGAASLLVVLHAPAQPQLRWLTPDGDPARAVVEVTGLPAPELEALRRLDADDASWQHLLAVRAEPAENDPTPPENLPAMLGRLVWHEDNPRFVPQFALEPGVRYRAVLRLAEQPEVGAIYQLPATPRQPVTRVVAVHPGASLLPVNQLKFYLEFSAPMSRGLAPRHVRLLDARGQAVELPFLELDEELWNPDQTRLTLLLDPGRVKRGLLPLDEAGPALREGEAHTLVIDAAWPDADGVGLVETFRHSFNVGPADRQPPDPARWRLEAPAAGTREALLLHFDEPMDHALATRLISVQNQAGLPVAGAVFLEKDDQTWRFVPKQPWTPDPHQLAINMLIEDLAGNHIGRVFDVDTFERVSEPVKTEATLPFTPRP